MNREMTVFFALTVLFGAVLFSGLQMTPQLPHLATPKSPQEAPSPAPAPTGRVALDKILKERRNPFAPPVEMAMISQPKPPVHVDNAPPPPPPPPTAPVVAIKPPTINKWSPAEIPVALAGIFALPDQPPEAHLTAKDGSTMIVHVGDEIKSLGVTIKEISANDVTVQVGDRLASLDAVIAANNATDNPATAPQSQAPNTKPNLTAPDILKKLLGKNGKLDFAKLGALSPDEKATLATDPNIMNAIEQAAQQQQQQQPKNDTRPQNRPERPNHGGAHGGARGGARSDQQAR
ncbi:MAG: hypothetical protein ACREJ2_14290 [Planctomycetota bacterium]